MTTNTLQVLPLWMWLSFAIIVVGIIAIIYTQGNWRLTLALVGLSLFTVFLANEIDRWSGYINSHFIGHYDSLGVPFREAGPGWSLLWSGWPLWLVPILITIIATLFVVLFIHHLRAPTKPEADTAETLPLMQMASTTNLTKKLEIESIKQELTAIKEKLAATSKLAEQQLDEHHELEIKILHNKKVAHKNITELEDKIAALTLELNVKEAEVENLRALNLEQAEEIADCKAELKSHGLH